MNMFICKTNLGMSKLDNLSSCPVPLKIPWNF